MNLELTGKVVVITGPAKGMGAAVSLGFAEEGANLALLGRDLDAIEPVAEKARSYGVHVEVVYCDVTNPDSVTKSIATVMEAFDGAIDVLVNVAGGTGPIGKTGVQTPPEEFQDILQVNVNGPFNMIRAVAPTMQARQSGKIVNVGGTFGLRGRALRLAYSSSKWGLRGLTKSFALELGADNINVNYVAPGMVDGPRFRDKVVPQVAAQFDISEADAVKKHASDYALQRITSDHDIASATLFLSSERARQITGIDLPIDGGWASL